MAQAKYTESNIRSLDWKQHIRLRPGMYIGKLGDGSSPDDGIYVLLKEIIDNSIDEFVMKAGNRIEISLQDDGVLVRDFGRGIPLGKVVDCVSKINTGGKYDSEAFKKSVGLNGVGTKAVNALSQAFEVTSYRGGKGKTARFTCGELIQEKNLSRTGQEDGTAVFFRPDQSIFKDYKFDLAFIEAMVWNYVFLNTGLTIHFQDTDYQSKRGLLDLLERNTQSQDIRYPVIFLKDHDIEVAFTHGDQYGEEHYSFVNGQHTTMGGSHQVALREGVVKGIREFFKKDFDAADIRSGLIAAISVKVQDPVFESQTKTKLGSQKVSEDGPTVRSWVVDFLKLQIDNYLHREPEVAIALQKKILQSEKERKEMAGIKKIASERTKKANLYNKKLRDCRVHYGSSHKRQDESMIFITEGDSASGSLTKARDVQTQAVFSLRGKPLNSYGLTKKIVYENEEFSLLQHALNIEDGLEGLRYAKIIIATDADVDGMHIRLLIMTFFLQFFPELVRNGHVFILQTPLFRVRNKEETIYCYDETQRKSAITKLGKKAEITRFKGLGEISPKEFGQFIGAYMRIEQVRLTQKTAISELLKYFMGKNTQERQKFIIDNLRSELDSEEMI
ncbi:MAG: type IIA DNA topoisomerase subunit B [Pseudobacteriovorax sp.]|nr:type IIA DNA topoisomerase subunit B [Pseudobacteriovorax sp.]